MVAQEQPPLAPGRDRRRALEDLVDRGRLLAAHRHEHPRHDREVEAHLAFVVVAEVLHDVGGPLVGLGEQHAVGVVLVDLLAHLLQELVRLPQVLADRALSLVQVGHRVQPEAVQAHVEPEAQRLQHRVVDLGVVVVEVRLMGEEAVPVVGARDRVIGPVRRLGVGEDDAGVLVALVGVRPHVPVALGVVRARSGLLEPRVIGGGVVHHQVGDHPDAAGMGGVDQLLHIVDRAVVGVHAGEVRDVVAAVAQRGLEERQQPDAVDAQPLQVVELLDQSRGSRPSRRRCRRRSHGCGSRRTPRA